MSSGKCGTCGESASMKCSGCGSVFYCGKTHQKDHWPKHRSQCRRLFHVQCWSKITPRFKEIIIDKTQMKRKQNRAVTKIRTTPELGCHLVSSRDLKENEVILSENPSVIGQRGNAKFPNCIGCCVKLGPVLSAFCPRCRWPACNPNCPKLVDEAFHGGGECPVLLAMGLVFGYQWEFIFPVRVMFLLKRNPKLAQWMQKRAPYAEARLVKPDLKDGLIQSLTLPLSVMAMLAQPFPDCTFEAMKKVFAVNDAFSLRLPESRTGSLNALYPNASLLQHSCAPNTRFLFDVLNSNNTAENDVKLGRVTVKAVRNISRGEILTWGWSHQMYPTPVRQQELAAEMNMRCSCARCIDPTELGSNFGTLKCLICSGWVLPVGLPQIGVCDWKCHGKCGYVFDSLVADLRFLSLSNQLSEAKATDIRFRQAKLEALLRKFEKIDVHPNHYHSVMLKHALLKTYGNIPNSGGIAALSDADLQRKADLGRDVVRAIEHFGNCMCRCEEFASECLSELTDAEAEIMKRKLKSGEWTTNEAKTALTTCCTMLRRAMKLETYAEALSVESARLNALSTKIKDLCRWAKDHGLVQEDQVKLSPLMSESHAEGLTALLCALDEEFDAVLKFEEFTAVFL